MAHGSFQAVATSDTAGGNVAVADQTTTRAAAGLLRYAVAVLSVTLATIVGCGCNQDRSQGQYVPAPPTDIHSRSPRYTTAQLRRMRVRLDQSATSTKIGILGPYTITDADGRQLHQSYEKLPATKVTLSNGGLWHIGPWQLSAGQIVIRPTNGDPVQVGRRRYRGILHLESIDNTSYSIINVLDIEDYLKGVLAAEMPTSYPIQALRAQAIAARTYALYQRFMRIENRSSDVENTVASQVYIGMSGESPKAIQAINSTRGIVATHTVDGRREMFCTYFSSTCGGVTQSSVNVKGSPPVVPLSGGVQCPYCAGTKHSTWGPVTFTYRQITKALHDRYKTDLGTVQQLRVVEQTPEGRMVWVDLVDTAGKTYRIRGEDLRLILGAGDIKSTWCDVRNTANAVVFENGKGYGHGMGLCQVGAGGMARQGFTGPQIIEHYYPGCELVRAYR